MSLTLKYYFKQLIKVYCRCIATGFKIVKIKDPSKLLCYRNKYNV